MLLAELVATSQAVAGTRSRKQKVAALAGTLRSARVEELPVVASYLAGEPRQERLDVGWAALEEEVPPAAVASLDVAEVDAALQACADEGGPGSRGRRLQGLRTLLARATPAEQRFVVRLVLGELRQGALSGLVAQAVATAAGVGEPAVRRALMLSGDLGEVARLALGDGEEGLRRVRLELFRPVLPMLASTAADAHDAMRDLDAAAVEWKLDGMRVQVHRRGDDVRVYSRNLRDVTARSSGVVDLVAGLDVREVVLDGEVLALDDRGRPVLFQDSMRALGDRTGPRPFFFDILRRDGVDLLDAPVAERQAALAAVVPEPYRVVRREVHGAAEAERVLADAVAAGHEGVVVKALDAPYEAGRRGAAWRKVKPVHTLDLVVLAVEWGSGRRPRVAVEHPPRCPRRPGRVRHARQDVQGHDRRDARLADPAVPGARDGA